MDGLAPAVGERLDARIRDLMAAYGVPGVAIAVTDREALLDARVYGHADVAAREPVTLDHLFEIGSIGKAFTATALMRLVEEGRVDLGAPVTEYLPWFQIQSRFEPITVHHLLNHTAGIIVGPQMTSDSRFDVWALRHTETGAAPGTSWGYSDVGYRTLGFLLEEVEGRPYSDIIRSRILDPLGMASTEAVITNQIRSRLAVGYMPHPDDRPVRYEAPLVPATWLETGTGDGSLASTGTDMATFLRVWLNRGRPLLAERSFARMTVDGAFPSEEGATYGYGLATRDVDGRRYLGHGGDMVGYASTMAWEPEAGFGVVILTNCLAWEDWPVHLYREVLAWLRADARCAGLPDPTPKPDFLHVEDPQQYTGVYGDVTVTTEGVGLSVERAGTRVPLQRRPGDRFLADHPDWDPFLLGFERDEAGTVVAVHHGGRRWPRGADHESGVDTDSGPYSGHYRSTNPWTTNFRVVRRDGEFVLIHARGFEESLVPLAEHRFRVGAEETSAERLEFDAIVDGWALRATLSGCEYYRAFTP